LLISLSTEVLSDIMVIIIFKSSIDTKYITFTCIPFNVSRQIKFDVAGYGYKRLYMGIVDQYCHFITKYIMNTLRLVKKISNKII
jgi:GTP-binding protein EngB required for normal cell division